MASDQDSNPKKQSSLLEVALARQNELEKLIHQKVGREVKYHLLEFLKKARAELDERLEKKELEINRSPRAPTTLLGLFSWRSKKIAPLPLPETKLLSNEELAEFDTARHILYDIFRFVTTQKSAMMMVQAAAEQEDLLQSDLERLAKGVRLEKYWNDPVDSLMYTNELDERQLMGAVKDPVILEILHTVSHEFKNYSDAIDKSIKKTVNHITKMIEKESEQSLKQFSTSPVGEYFVVLVELQQKARKLLNAGIPAEIVNVKLNKLADKLGDLREYMSPIDSKKADQLEQIDFSKKDMAVALMFILPDVSYKELMDKVQTKLREDKKEQPESFRQYRRPL